MAYSFVCLFALLALTGVKVGAITNGELFRILKNSGEAQEYAITGRDVEADDSDNVIQLTGDDDDEVDVGMLMAKLGLLNSQEADFPTAKNQSVGSTCNCVRDSCTCCITVRVNYKTCQGTIKACVTVQYIPSDTAFILAFILQGRQVYRKVVSIIQPPKICSYLTCQGLNLLTCLKIYNANVQQKSLCTRLSILVDYKEFNFNIACFKIPLLINDGLTGLQEGQLLPSSMDVSTSDDDKMITAN